MRVPDVRLYFDVVGMSLVHDGPEMRERPVIVRLPSFPHQSDASPGPIYGCRTALTM